MGYNGCLSLKNPGKSVRGQNLPYPFLRGQPLNLIKQDETGEIRAVDRETHLGVDP